MAGFSLLERRLGMLFHRLPQVKARLKFVYQALNYSIYRERGFRYALDEGIVIKTPGSLIGSDEPGADVAEFCGYYDASPWSPCGRYLVTNQVRADEREARIVVYDLVAKQSTDIASTPAWTLQQGSMCRWLTVNGKPMLCFNQVEKGVLGTAVVSPAGGAGGFIGMPLQAINATNNELYSINYLRLAANGTEYGYDLKAANLSPGTPLEDDGIWAVDLDSHERHLLVCLADLAENHVRPEMAGASHEVNHVSVAPDGQRFVFIHRFRGERGQYSRLYVAARDGRELSLLLDDGMVSHYTWIDDRTLLTWSRKEPMGDDYFRVDVESGEVTAYNQSLLRPYGDGHPTFLPQKGLVTDSYPDRKRQQHLLHVLPDGRIDRLGRFLSPLKFSGFNRVDLHPRWSPDGSAVSIDSGFSGQRRTYVLDLSGYYDRVATR